MTGKIFGQISALCLALIMLCSCGGNDTFKVKGEIEGKPTMNIIVRYYGNDAVQTIVTAARDGVFEINGASRTPTVVEILDNDYNLIGRVYAQNGDKITCKLDRSNPFRLSVEGNLVAQEWAQVTTANADSLLSGSPEAVNSIVERYIAENPTSTVGSLLFATCYHAFSDPQRADSVLHSIPLESRAAYVLDSFFSLSHRYAAPTAFAGIDSLKFRTATDSVRVFRPAKSKASLIVMSTEVKYRRDTLVPRLKEIYAEYPQKRLQIVDLVLLPDTAAWKRTVRPDSAKWVQGWMPGVLLAEGIERLAVPRMPYFIVTDSAGNQVYRGETVAEAQLALQRIIPSR